MEPPSVETNLNQRIAIVGTSGAGKTTLARQISQQMGIPHVELDALHWQPNWVETPTEVFQIQVAEALSGDRWVVDGNYNKVRHVIWSRADTIVWLDYPFPVVLGRLLKRTVWRVTTRQELWNGNREGLRETFSQDSILLWMIRTHWQHRKTYPLLFQQPEYAHLKVVRLSSPQAAQQWLVIRSP
ncbi:ATP-binding cassette domain-containing protein [Kovacikia minuta CCNUW1]|uniref:ATP-binding cassette domain-containing protein n=1 Tax=Kovacikia minuta TaxID=2931930 RepID=UPI001CCF36A4|nr:AAA family ATPase [Kovacikia minuta]UBF29358.1 ATP-binding cassette domain-containing protein [Kovacikia minuta CCNUW1]